MRTYCRYMPQAPETPESPALTEALRLARRAFHGDRATLNRLERARQLATHKLTHRNRINGGWNVSDGWGGFWRVIDGVCTCPDRTENHPRYCKHELAVMLVLKVEELEHKEGAGSATDTPAPEPAPKGTGSRGHDTTRRYTCQIQP